MNKNRDNFSQRTIKTLERRAGGRCSNPAHRVSTAGPTSDPQKANCIGIAAHITAASPGGPRYASHLSDRLRKDIGNAIWLCNNCATMIDKDPAFYSISLLQGWKDEAERSASRELLELPISRREYDALRSLAFSDLPKTQISTAIQSIIGLSRQELERLDNRFDVRIDYIDNKPHYHLTANTQVNLGFELRPEVHSEFSRKYQRLIDHGHSLEMPTIGIRITGSPLISDFFNDDGTLYLETTLKKPIVLKVAVLSTDGVELFRLDDMYGTATAGKRSVTMAGTAYDGIFTLEITRQFDEISQAAHTINVGCNFGPWDSKSLLNLPYFKKIFDLFSFWQDDASLSLTVEIDGQKILSGQGSISGFAGSLGGTGDLLVIVDMMRQVLGFLGTDAIFRNNISIASETVQKLSYYHHLTIVQPRLHGKEIPSLRFTLQERAVESEAIRGLMQGEPTVLRFDLKMGDRLNFFDKQIDLAPASIYYSSVELASPILGELVECKWELVPCDDCNISVYKTIPNITS